ncbi:MAG TPA: hypothetical protein VEN81_13350 [Planctomycetota bacterium]|nr:hypothetical protein [Planctomycetota bacterium]
MISRDAQYEVKQGRLFVNHEPIPLRKGAIYAALVRAGWKGQEGPLPADLVENMLRLDQRVSVIALEREAQSAA